jgi:hypothetical protein
MKDTPDIQKLKAQITLLNVAVHALCVAAEPAKRSMMLGMFQQLAEQAKADLLATSADEATQQFFDEMRTSLEKALSP